MAMQYEWKTHIMEETRDFKTHGEASINLPNWGAISKPCFIKTMTIKLANLY